STRNRARFSDRGNAYFSVVTWMVRNTTSGMIAMLSSDMTFGPRSMSTRPGDLGRSGCSMFTAIRRGGRGGGGGGCPRVVRRRRGVFSRLMRGCRRVLPIVQPLVEVAGNAEGQLLGLVADRPGGQAFAVQLVQEAGPVGLMRIAKTSGDDAVLVCLPFLRLE